MNAEGLLGTFDFRTMESFLERAFPQNSISFGQLVVEMMSGGTEFDVSLLWKAFLNALLYGISDSKKMFFALFVLGLVSVILYNAAGMFKEKQTMQIANYFVTMLGAIALIQGFEIAFHICQSCVELVMDFIRIFLPVYCLSLGFVKGAMTAYGYYQFVFVVLYLLQQILIHVFLPLTKCFILLTFMNGLVEDKRFEGIQKLIEKGIGTGLKCMTYLVVGTGMFRTLLTVRVDHLNKTVLQKAVAAIPAVGDVTDSATQMILSCGSLVQGGLGSAALIVLVLICLTPLVKLLFLYGSLQVSSSLIGLLGEKNMTKTTAEASKAFLFLFQIAFFTLLMFMLIIGLMMYQM